MSKQAELLNITMRCGVSEKDVGFLHGAVHNVQPCGCKIIGNGTTTHPLDIEWCGKHSPQPNDERTKEIVEHARDNYEEEGRIEIDDDAKLSDGDDNGTYVQAWVWISFAGTKWDKEKSEE